jgi:hypothetical protein
MVMMVLDFNEDWREVKQQKKSVLALMVLAYVVVGFISPMLRFYFYIKENIE